MSVKYVSTLTLIFFTACLFGQTQVAKINDIYKKRVVLPDEVVPLVDPVSKQFALCFFRGKTIHGYLFDERFRIIDSLQSEDKRKSYKQIFGKTILKNNDYVVFVTDNRRKKFGSVRFSFDNGQAEFFELELDLGNERIIQTADFNNKFHILTVAPRTSTVNVYRFDDEKSYVKFPLDFSDDIFLDERQKEANIYDLLTVSSGIYGLGKSIDLVKIEPSNPTTLETACNPTKFYSQDNKVFISFDENDAMTQLIDIDLKTMKGELKVIAKALGDERYKDRDGNSFLNGDLLYQISTTRDLLHLRAINYKTQEVIHEHTAVAEDAIAFKNSSIVQTGGAFDNHREFESTDKLLRKIKRGEVGIAVFKTKKHTRVTFGGVIEKKQSAGFMMPGFGLPVASIGAVTIFFNPAFFAFESYVHTKALTVDGLFDENFMHKSGDINENVFDQIQEFQEEENISTAGKTLFKIDDTYFLGSYSSFNKEYTLWAFEQEAGVLGP
ncbi:MAG: hypothetical protein WA913_03290 [Pricia sp.]